MIEKAVSQSVIYIALECILMTEGVTAGSVVMSLCLFVVMTVAIILPEKNLPESPSIRIHRRALCLSLSF